ncbi:MAG: hypothetical protein M1816_003032 [Peltula sp. TS41687]|nr:MAG: hypothetical protein M1816_003032 [Peltula sp. TS41687]
MAKPQPGGESRKRSVNYHMQSTAQNHSKGSTSDPVLATSAKYSASVHRDDCPTFVTLDCQTPITVAPDAVSRDTLITNRTWDPARNAITFATREGAERHIQDTRAISPPKPNNAKPEDQKFGPSSTTPSPNESADPKMEIVEPKIFNWSGYDRLQRMAMLLESIRTTLSSMITTLRELEINVVNRLERLPAEIWRNDKDDKETVFRGDAGIQSNESKPLGFPPRPELQTACDVTGNFKRLGDSPYYPQLPDVYSEINGLIAPNLDAGDNHTADTVLTPPDEVPHVSFTYKIPPDLEKELTSASPLPYAAAYWRYDLYRCPQGHRVKVHYCRDLNSAEEIAKLFSGPRVLGLDLEWKPSATSRDGIQNNVSLLQLACEEHIALFHIGIFSKDAEVAKLISPILKGILESAEITKVGVAIKADCARLSRYLGIHAQGLLELSHLHKLVKVSSEGSGKLDKRLVSLAEQVEEHLGMPLFKGVVRRSDWTRPLDEEQVAYAASDAYAALHLYDVLERKRVALKPIPPRPAHAELNLPIRLAEGVSISPVKEVSTERLEIIEPPSPAKVLIQPSDLTVTTSESKLGPTHPYVILAGAWASQYRSEVKPPRVVRASSPHLRAYALWHLHQQEISDIAMMLRDPPLAETTVASYVFAAVQLQKLPHDIDRLRAIHDSLPILLQAKYKGMLGYSPIAETLWT